MWSLLLKFFCAKVKCLPLIHHWWHADDKGKVHHRTLYWVHRLKSKCHCAKVYTRIDYTVRLNCLIWHTVGTHTHPFSRFQPNKKIFSYFFKDSFNRISYKYKRIPPPFFFTALYLFLGWPSCKPTIRRQQRKWSGFFAGRADLISVPTRKRYSPPL